MRSWKFWAFLAAWAVAFWLLETLVPTGRLDPYILLGIGVTFVLVPASMAAVRRAWNDRALGIFGGFLGTGLLFLALWLGWSVREHPTTYNAIRALLIVAGPLADIGWARWVIAYRRGGTDSPLDPGEYRGPDKRQPGVPGRRSSDWVQSTQVAKEVEGK